MGRAGTDPHPPTGVPSLTAVASSSISPDPFLSRCPEPGDLLGCLLLHLCIKAQPSENDGCPGEKERELEPSYSIQPQSTV